jgi:DNA-binding response OmpR family regulator
VDPTSYRRDPLTFKAKGHAKATHASRLRRKLNHSSETAFVLNVWGGGYRFVASAA